jgi:hypothetical protein
MLLSANFSEVEAIAQKKVTDLPRILRFNFGIWLKYAEHVPRSRPLSKRWTITPALPIFEKEKDCIQRCLIIEGRPPR